MSICYFFLTSYLVRTDPKDVARVEGKTFIVTENKYDTVPHVKDGVSGILGKWKSPIEMTKELHDRFPTCMKGKYCLRIHRYIQ